MLYSIKKNIFIFLIFSILPGFNLFSAAKTNKTEITINTVKIPQENLFIPFKLDNIDLFHNEERGFFIKKDNVEFLVKTEYLDKELRGLTNNQLAFLLGRAAIIDIDGEEQIFIKSAPFIAEKFFENNDIYDCTLLSNKAIQEIISQLPPSSYIHVFQYDNGEYGLHLKPRCLGGGLWGATIGFWFGKAFTHAVVQTIAWGTGSIVGLFCPPAGVILGSTLAATLSVPAEVFSNIVGLSAGITLAVATGPV